MRRSEEVPPGEVGDSVKNRWSNASLSSGVREELRDIMDEKQTKERGERLGLLRAGREQDKVSMSSGLRLIISLYDKCTRIGWMDGWSLLALV